VSQNSIGQGLRVVCSSATTLLVAALPFSEASGAAIKTLEAAHGTQEVPVEENGTG
jgi:hypothetical protein